MGNQAFNARPNTLAVLQGDAIAQSRNGMQDPVPVVITDNARRFAQQLYGTDQPSAEQTQAAQALLANTAQNLLDNNLGVTVPYAAQADAFLQTLKVEYQQAHGTLTLPGTSGQTKTSTPGSAGFGSDSGAASSTTLAAISGLAGPSTSSGQAGSARTGDQESSIAPIFDKERVRQEVGAQVAITQAFGQQAPKLVADFTQERRETLKLQAWQAEQAGDSAQAGALREEAARWDEGGAFHVGLQALTGALSGGATGALGAASVAAAAPVIETITSQLPLPEPLQAVAGMIFSSALGAATGASAGAAMAFNVDVNNRSLHSSERKTAIALARASNGQYSVQEIEAQLRQMPNLLLAQGGQPALYANMQDPATQARWVQDRLQDPDLPIASQGSSVIERQGAPNADIQAFIVTQTTFTSGALAGHSPYAMTPSAAAQVLNQAVQEQAQRTQNEQPRYFNCASTDCLLMGANYNPNNPQNRAELERREGVLQAAGVIVSGPALVAAAATPAGQAALVALLGNSAAATGAAAGAAANAGVQLATTGTVDPLGVLVGGATGALGGGAAANLATAFKNPVIGFGAAGASVVGVNAAGAVVTNSPQSPTAAGSLAGFGVGQMPVPGAPLWGAITQEAATYLMQQYLARPDTRVTDLPTRGGQ